MPAQFSSVWIAACALGGCAVARFTAVEAIGGETPDGESSVVEASIDGAADASGDVPDGPSNEEEGSDAGPVSSSCTDPAFVTASPFGIWNSGGYFLYNNMWDTDAGPGPQTLYACSYHSWYVVSDQPEGTGAVKTYPNVQMNFSELPLGSFHSVTSMFAETSPHVGIYEDAFDIWLNGVATASSSQIMIWVDNFNRIPPGSQVTTTRLGGRTYDVWKTSNNSLIVLVSTVPFTSGTVDLLEIFNWAVAQGWLPSNTTLGQIDFGVEIVSTGGASATYLFDDFTIAAN
jgi:glycosyl hydrolase family 12